MSKKEKWEELYEGYKANNMLTIEEVEGKWNSQDEEYRKRLSEIADTTTKEYKQLKSEWKKLKVEFEFEKKSLEKYKGIAKNADKIERAKSNRDVYQSLLDELLDARKEDEATIERRRALKEEADKLEEELKELKEIEDHLRYGLKNPICTEEDKERISKRLAENIEKQNENQKAFSNNQLALQKELEVSMHSVPEEQIEEAKQGVDKFNKVCELLAEGKTMAEVTATLDKLKPEAAKPKAAEQKAVKPEDTKPEFYVPELEEDEVQVVTTGKDTTKTKVSEPKTTELKAIETKAAKTGVNIEEERKDMERFQKFTELASRREKIYKTIDEKVGLSESKDTILKEVRDQFIDWIIDMAVYDETNPSKYSDPKDIPTREEIINKMRKEFKEKYPDKTLEDVLAEEIGSYIEKEINKFKSNVEKQESKVEQETDLQKGGNNEPVKPEHKKPEDKKPEEIKPEEVIPELQLEDLEFEDVYSYVGIDGILIKSTKEGFVMAYAFKESFEDKTDDEIDYEEAVKTMELSYADGDLENDLNDGFDSNIERLLDELWNNGIISDDEYNSYIYEIEEGEKMPFWVTYDLRDIYKTDLTNKEIKNLFKIAKQAKKNNPDIKVKKDNILKRALGRASRTVKSTINRFKGLKSAEKQEALPEANFPEMIPTTVEKEECTFVPTYSQEAQNIGKAIKSCSTMEDITSIYTEYHEQISGLSSDEKEYLDNILEGKKQEFKENSREVKTVHPDGRVEIGRRIFSIEDDDFEH